MIKIICGPQYASVIKDAKKGYAEQMHFWSSGTTPNQEGDDQIWQHDDNFEILTWAVNNMEPYKLLKSFTKGFYVDKYNNIHSSLFSWTDLRHMEEEGVYPWMQQEGTTICRTPGCKREQHPKIRKFMKHCCKACAIN